MGDLIERLRDDSAHEGERVADIMVRWNLERREAADVLQAYVEGGGKSAGSQSQPSGRGADARTAGLDAERAAAFTPGPWEVSEATGLTDAGLPEFLVVAGEGDAFGLVGTALELPDAHLQAAAPDLLEALKTFVAEYVELVVSGDAGFWDAEAEAKVIAARAAIAKATGLSGGAHDAEGVKP